MDHYSKFQPQDKEAIRFFVQQGYVIYENVHDQNLIKHSSDWFLNKYQSYAKNNKDLDVNGWAVEIMDGYRLTKMGEEFVTSPTLVEIMHQFLGQDICIFNNDALWINVPQDTDPVLLKGIHTDAWTGTSVNTIFSKTFFTNVDKYNSMSVVPGTHLYGLVPVKNREVDAKLSLKPLNLQHINQGDVLIWHPLLLHSTTGHSDKNIRVSVTSRFTSTESAFSSQERSLGYRTLSVGPMNQILRLIGNDQLQPFRTLGGFVGVDRRLKQLYNYSPYKND